MLVDLNSGAKNLILEIQELQNIDEKLKKKHIIALKSIIKDCESGNEILARFMKGDDYMNAFMFVKNKGKEDYYSKYISTPKSDKILLFIDYTDTFTDEEYWKNLREAYTMQDFQAINYELLIKLFSSSRSERNKLMSTDESLFLENLSEEIQIYRGGSIDELENGFGISWSLDKKIATKFVNIKSNLTKKKMVVHEIIIPKANVIAYINSRQEEEIIYLGN
jgi:hypothetical protein